MKKKKLLSTTYFPKTAAIGVHAPYNRTTSIDAYFREFESLLKTNETDYAFIEFIKLRSIDSSYFFTLGKLEELKKICDEHEIEHIVISEPLTTLQVRNLSDYLDCSITDRTELILEIFEKAAHSAEGKTQVAIARFKHMKSRLAGKGIFLEQQAGAIGQRGGPGETIKEREKRTLDRYIHNYKQQLANIKKIREVQRKRRLESNIPFLCLIGYTNAGKSTILNAITKSDVLAEDKLFATLDTTTRELYIDGKKQALISDTVGFIQLLPTQLIEAFKSTLSELSYAHLLIHVVDISDPNWQDHIKVVHHILDELDIQKKMVYIFNKIDKLDADQIETIKHEALPYQPHLFLSAQNKDDVSILLKFLVKQL